MFYGGFGLLAVMLIVAGWLMVNENIGELRRGSGYDVRSRDEAAWSGIVMALFGVLLLIAGLAIAFSLIRGLNQ